MPLNTLSTCTANRIGSTATVSYRKTYRVYPVKGGSGVLQSYCRVSNYKKTDLVIEITPTVHCTVYSVLYTVYCIPYTVPAHSIHCMLYTARCTIYIIQTSSSLAAMSFIESCRLISFFCSRVTPSSPSTTSSPSSSIDLVFARANAIWSGILYVIYYSI